MKNKSENILTFRNMRLLLFIVLVYFSQVTPFYHIHYFHDNGSLEFEISSHLAEVDVDHSSEHHHDQDSPHTKDHQHTYNDKIEWNIVRTQSQRKLPFVNQYIISSIYTIIIDNKNRSYIDFEKPSIIQAFETSTLIIRGPPLSANFS